MSSARRGFALGTLGLLLVSLASTARAQSSWAVAERTPEQITSLISKLVPYVEKLPGEKNADGVVLYSQVQYDVKSADNKSRQCRNYVVEVRNLQTDLKHVTHPTFDSSLDLQEAFGFVLRDGKVSSLDEAAVTISPSQDEHQRASVQFDFGELQKGDILGWSVVAEQGGPVYAAYVPAGDVFPVVIANVKISTDGEASYTVVGEGVPAKEVDHSEKSLQNGRPTQYSATLRALPAQDVVYTQGPFPKDFPHVWFYMEAVYLEESASPPMRSGWMQTGGMNRIAGLSHGVLEAKAKKVKGLDMVLGAVTAGKATDEAKEQAIYSFVRDRIELLEGDGFERNGARDPEVILKAKTATSFEKSLLMAVMLREVGSPVTLGFLRSRAYGDPSDKHELLFQLSDAVVRGGTDQPRFYAPQCSACEPGILPADLQGLTVVSPVDGLTELQEGFRAKAIEQFTTGAPPTPKEIFDLQDSQPWHRVETTPANSN